MQVIEFSVMVNLANVKDFLLFGQQPDTAYGKLKISSLAGRNSLQKRRATSRRVSPCYI